MKPPGIDEMRGIRKIRACEGTLRIVAQPGRAAYQKGSQVVGSNPTYPTGGSVVFPGRA